MKTPSHFLFTYTFIIFFCTSLFNFANAADTATLNNDTYTVSFKSNSGIIPDVIVLDILHHPDAGHGGTGTTKIINLSRDKNNITWKEYGSKVNVILTQTNKNVVKGMNDFSFVIEGGISGLTQENIHAQLLATRDTPGTSINVTAIIVKNITKPEEATRSAEEFVIAPSKSYTVTFSSLTIPYIIDITFDHDADVKNGGYGKADVVDATKDKKNIIWEASPSSLKVILSESTKGTVQDMNDFTFYVDGGITGLIPSKVVAYNKDAGFVEGVTSSIIYNP